MTKKLGYISTILLALLVCTNAIIACGYYLGHSHGEQQRQRLLNLVDKIDAGDLGLHEPMAKFLELKPQMGAAYEDDNGDTYAVWGWSRGGDTLLVYFRDQQAIAAQHTEIGTGSKARWLFADTEAMREYIESALNSR